MRQQNGLSPLTGGGAAVGRVAAILLWIWAFGLITGTVIPVVVQGAGTVTQGTVTPSTEVVTEAPEELISYQGRLSDSGSPASGSYDFQFLLKNAVSAGTTLGDVIKLTLTVQNGVFTASLPWKPSLFTGAARWIEVRVRPTPAAGASASETDAPYAVLDRQRLFSTPYAFRSLAAATVDSVPVGSLPSSVPLKGSDGKLDSSVIASDIARSTEVAALAQQDGVIQSSIKTLEAANTARISDIATLTAKIKSAQDSAAAALLESNQQNEARFKVLSQDVATLKQSVQTLEGANASRILEIAAVTTTLQTVQDKWAAAQQALEARLVALSQENTVLKQSVQTLSAPARSGWMAASTLADDPELVAAGFTLVSSTAAPGWVAASAAAAPSPRFSAASVWTGQEWIVWGGSIAGQASVASGSRYRPDSDTWSEVSQIDAPEARTGHAAVWTGTEMLIWGGFNGRSLNSGGRYTPNPQTWSPMSSTGAPSPRTGHGAVWTGRSMVVYGGKNTSGLLADGGVYDPVDDTWSSLPSEGAPSPRQGASVIWTGKAVLVWGGETSPSDSSSDLADGAVLNFSADGKPLSWSPIPTLAGLSARSGHASAWDGRRLMIWGGRTRSGTVLTEGAVWDSETSKWTVLTATGAPQGRFDASAAWTGDEFVIFGGSNNQGALASGAAWNAASGTWRSLPSQAAASARSRAASVLVGSQWMIFGGLSSTGVSMADPQRIDVRPPWNLYRRGSLPAESLPISSP